MTEQAPVFLPGHAAALLAFIGSVDDRFQEVDATVSGARIRSWAVILRDVDPSFAMSHARRFYATARPNRITPAEIRTAWMAHLRREEAMNQPKPPQSVPAPPGIADYLRAVLKAAREGRPVEDVPRPEAGTMTPAQDHLTRRCRHWRGCACDHVACRDGWLDRESRIGNALGRSYPAVEPCPHCRDAALMAAEAATPVRRHR